VRVFERTRVRRVGSGQVAGDGFAVRAGAVVVAAGALGGALPPLRNRVTVGSSHLLITEPVPDVIEALGWTGGEAISDARALLHYFRTTPDGRIAFGWAGGRMAPGLRLGGRADVDPEVIARTARDLVRVFPALRGRRIEHAWGGPIDVSPSHFPQLHRAGDRVWAAFGYTGNGVGPSYAIGSELAHRALGGAPRFETPASRRVPPEPLRIAGAAALRRALIVKEAREEAGRDPGALLRAAADVPRRLGMRIVR
jgi:glycine/D-amino acid oxidase-like deaminating enzyme